MLKTQFKKARRVIGKVVINFSISEIYLLVYSSNTRNLLDSTLPFTRKQGGKLGFTLELCVVLNGRFFCCRFD